MRKIFKFFVTAVMIMLLSGYTANRYFSAQVDDLSAVSSHFAKGVFKNSASYPKGNMAEAARRLFSESAIDQMPTVPLPQKNLSREQLDALSADTVHLVKLGHSSILLKVYGEYWLIDPVFSQRVSPVSFAGPKRFTPTLIDIEALPPIKRVLISHNHYDHLDKATIQALAVKTEAFFVPLGVEGDLIRWGVDGAKVKSFDWWQEQQTETGLIAFTPSQHFSGRAIGDGDKTLWGSWVMIFADQRIYFSGDSGYFAGFKAIGDRYGPFDLALLETGAYDVNWANIHMFPEQTVQASIDLQASVLMPIHNASFDLAFHPWYEPLDRVLLAANAAGVELSTPILGAVFSARSPAELERWWQDYK